jgi:hypothetical protein
MSNVNINRSRYVSTRFAPPNRNARCLCTPIADVERCKGCFHDDHHVTRYDSCSERAVTSALSCRTISLVSRMLASLSVRPMLDATESNRVFSVR